MSEPLPNGSQREINGRTCVFYDGYWIRKYDPPTDSLNAKKRLIEALTHRLFNHVEHGINMPGFRLDEARCAYSTEADPDKKRVIGAMLAGALFNRATDIFRKLVELQELGVQVGEEDSLMHECGQCLIEALEFGENVHHRSGAESIDELWGEPFKAFSIPIEAFYESRYIKIAQTMRDIDHIANVLSESLSNYRCFSQMGLLIRDFSEAAKLKCETLRTDPAIFSVWPSFVVAGERLELAQPQVTDALSDKEKREIEDGNRLIQEGKSLLTYITRARVPMPKSTKKFLARCRRYSRRSSEQDNEPLTNPNLG